MSIFVNNKYSISGTIIELVKKKQEEILAWLEEYEKVAELPLYSSVDIRDAGFKIAGIDTNLFPGGFNNLCEHGLKDSVKYFREAILKRVPACQDILIIAEEHTRNTWYLENVRILGEVIEKAGFHVKIATFLFDQPVFCESRDHVEMETSTAKKFSMYCLKKLLSRYEAGDEKLDLIIMNNDLTTGIPDVLKNSTLPVYPSIQAGWHARLKSYHFCYAQDLIDEFAAILGLDPWLFSTPFSVIDNVNINNEEDRFHLMDEASAVFSRIEKKYKEHKIDEKPYIFMKADAGTYGMAVMPIEEPSEILSLNRKDRNKLYKGKSSQVVERYLLQEGVPTIHNIDQLASEVCIYQIESNLIGGFYRSHAGKNTRENLNSKGMEFKKMCPHSKEYGDCGIHHNVNIFDVYRILARIAGLAAAREIIHLEAMER